MLIDLPLLDSLIPLTLCCQVHDLVSVNRHPLLRAPAQFPVSGWRDGPAAPRTGGARLLESQQLLGTEGLVVDLRGSFDQVLEVCARKEVAQVDEFTVSLVLNYQPSVHGTEEGRKTGRYH